MPSEPFGRDWTVTRRGSDSPERVDLPHDAMIGEKRSADEPSWAHGGYFPGGHYTYRKRWTPGPELAGKQVSLRFEGVYRHSRVLLDGRELGSTTSGYKEFEVRLDPHVQPGVEQVVEVEVDNSRTPNSRWYTGSGIYRPVWLEVRDALHIEPGGVAVTTTRRGNDARVAIDIRLANPAGDAARIDVDLSRAGRTVSGVATTTGSAARVEVDVEAAELWSAETPALYDLTLALSAGSGESDRIERRVGLRTIELEPGHGLLVNGRPVNLRGANIHHDNGVVGAATFAGSERRRVRILKEIGFNAIRSAHNPASRALLDACDDLGMYVMDEAYDGWYDHKTDGDDAEHFDSTWRDELASMVSKDRLHASVIMYSIGNENGEAFSPRGRRTVGEMSGELKRLDPDRSVTIGVNMVAASFAGLGKGYLSEPDAADAKDAPDMTSTAVNAVSNRFGFLMTRFPKLRGADRSTRGIFDKVDVAGYNYGTSRYDIDAVLHPERLVVGTETMPGDLARNWRLVSGLPSVIGDFVWAGWDYIGEAGGGTWGYGQRNAPFLKPYPQLTSGMGIIDITGYPGAAVRLAQAAWGTLAAPAITVRPLDVARGPVSKTAWRSTDAIESWSWFGHEGEWADLEVYSRDDEVEVLINGRSIGRRASGARTDFVTRFRTRYEPGVVDAIGYSNGIETSRSQLRTAAPALLRLVAEGDLGEDRSDVVYVRAELADRDGVVDTSATDDLELHVEGPATIAGFGSAAPTSSESSADLEHSTYRGRALIVLRATGADGPITLTARSANHGAPSVSVPRKQGLHA